jgi:TatD DNase family protein
MIDVHAHLNSGDFELTRVKVVEDAKKAEVEAIVDNAESFEENQRSLEISGLFDIIHSALGFNPCNLNKAEAEKIKNQIHENYTKIVAIGEIGLDFWKVKEQKETQIDIFEMFLRLAKELNLPVICHSRSAGRKVIEILEKNQIEKAILHAFDGNFASAKRGVELGYFFSVPPSINRSQQKQKLVERLPLENLLLESDSPLLGPVPGEQNTPANISVSAQEIARIKEIDAEQVRKSTTNCARKLLNIK